jgi:demethoxyubiquinone hydroxylase (CLK1/Coq7/Cat5 family)
LKCERGDVLILNDGDHHLHLQLMEPEEADHLHLCAKECCS